jgi:hypothetical protein
MSLLPAIPRFFGLPGVILAISGWCAVGLGFSVANAEVPRGRPTLNPERSTFVADNGQLLRGPYQSTEWTSAPPAAEVAKIKELGMNTVHLYAEVFDPNYPNPGSRAPGYARNEIDKVVQMTRDQGLYLILTIGNGANNGNHNFQWAVDFWNHYAPLYANESHVIYEIHNEPMAWGPSYLTGTTPPGTMDMQIAAYQAIRNHAPETPVLLFSYAVLTGHNAAMADIRYFNQQIFDDPDAVWTNVAVGFHGYGGWKDTASTVAAIIHSGYPCVMTEFISTVWGGGDGQDIHLTSELERLNVSWTSFLTIPPDGVSPFVTLPEHFKDLIERSGLSWQPDFGSWPSARAPFGNEGQPRKTTAHRVNNILTGTTRIEAEDFDTGGEGVAYHDTTPDNQGGAYRPGESVDIEPAADAGGGFNVGWISPGEWLEYNVWVQEPGYYDLDLRVSSIAPSGLRVIANGRDKTGEWTIPDTGGWQIWQTVGRQVFLEFGRQIIRIEFTGGLMNLNWFELTPAAAGPVASGTYKILNHHSGQAMQLDTATNRVVQHPDSGSAVQHWHLLHLGAGQYRITSAHNNNHWNVSGGPGSGIPLTWWWGADNGGQLFVIRDAGNGTRRIAPANSGFDYEVGNASFESGAPVVHTHINGYDGSQNLHWFILDASALGVPSGLTATGVSNQRIRLTWSPVPGATGYILKRSATPGGPYETVAAGITSSTYEDAGLSLGLTYHYVVSATAGGSEGPESVAAAGTPLGVVPGVPSPLAARLFNINMAGTTGNPAPVPEGTLIAAPSPVADGGFWNNLTANNHWSFTGPRQINDADNAAGITMNWSGHSGDHLIRWNSGNYFGLFKAMFGNPGGNWDLNTTFSGLDPAASYDIYWYSTWPENENPVTNTLTAGAADEPVRIIHPARRNVSGVPDYSLLREGVNHSIHADVTPRADGVIAIRSQGNRASVAGIQIVQRAAMDIPDAPSGLHATLVGDGTVGLAWNPVDGATGYTILRSDDPDGVFTTLAADLTETTFTDTTAVAGNDYTYFVQAFRTIWESPPSAPLDVSVSVSHTTRVHLRFDEASGSLAHDSSGNGWHGTLQAGAGRASGPDAFIHNALRLGGQDDHLVFAPGIVNGLANFTIATWVWWDGGPPWQRIFDFGSGTAVNMFLTPETSSGVLRYAITTTGAGGEQQINGDAPLPANEWTHVAVTLAGTTGTLFLNGEVAGVNENMTLNPAGLGNTIQNYVGYSQYKNPGGFLDPDFSGRLDDFRIYAGALPASAIASIASPPPAPADLIATGGDGSIHLSWSAPPDATGYRIARATSPLGLFEVIAEGIESTDFIDSPLGHDASFHYIITALHEHMESRNSAVAGSTTFPPPISRRELAAPFIGLAGESVTLSIPPTVPRRIYQLEWNDGLSGQWNDTGDPLVGDGGPAVFHVPLDPEAPRRFFRLRLQRQ